MSAPETDFAEAFFTGIESMEHARVIDFVRYVGRELDARPDFADMQFRDGWYIMLGGYIALAGKVRDL